MSQQSVRQAARPSALDALAERRKQRADRERRLEGLAVAVLTALGERDAAVRGADRRAGEALQTMTDDEGLSLREAIEWDTSASRRLRGGRAGHVNEERIGGGRMDHTVPIFFNGYAGLDSAVTTAKSSTSAPRTRLPSPSRAPSNKSSTTFAPRPRHNVALHQAHTAGTRRARSSHDGLQRSRSCTSTSLLSTRGG